MLLIGSGDSVENGDEEREDSGEGEAQEGARAEALESELNTAVNKIYELRDIIRGLEAKLEARSQAEAGQSEVIRDLKLGTTSGGLRSSSGARRRSSAGRGWPAVTFRTSGKAIQTAAP